MKEFGSVADLVRAVDFNKPVIALQPDCSARAARQFVHHFPGQSLFAIKANNRPEIVDTVYREGIRSFDVASLEEIRQASKYKDAELFFMNPIKDRHAIAEAYNKYGVRRFVVDTAEELVKIREETGEARDLIIFVRIAVPNDAAQVPLDGKFGTAPENGVVLLKQAEKFASELGISFHVGSQSLRPQAFQKALWVAADVRFASGTKARYLNVGGGFPVQYAGGKAPGLKTFFDLIQSTYEAQDWKGDGAPELLCEPGRALVAEAETLYTRVIGRKGKMLFINDGAFGTLFEGSQMYYGLTYPARRIMHQGQVILNEPDDVSEPYCLQGPTCDSADMMPGPYYLPANMQEGDVLELRNIGAYGHVLASPFNGFGTFDVVRLVENTCEQGINRQDEA